MGFSSKKDSDYGKRVPGVKTEGPEMVAQMKHMANTSKKGNTESVPTVKQNQPSIQGSNKPKGSGDGSNGSVGASKMSTSVMSRCKC